MVDRYVAVIQVEAVTDEVRVNSSASYSDKTKETPRIVGEVAKIVVRASTLEALKDRVAAHVALIEE